MWTVSPDSTGCSTASPSPIRKSLQPPRPTSRVLRTPFEEAWRLRPGWHLRDAGGRLSGRAEVISIEVKRGRQPFATTVGQASGYSVYADRTYLAEYRPDGFDDNQISIASRLGVGLIQLTGEEEVRITEVLSAPLREPLDGLRLEVIEKLGHSLCTICGSLFESHYPGKAAPTLVPQQDGVLDMAKAVREYKGVVYWLGEQAFRAKGNKDEDRIYHRRYVCPDCVAGLFQQPGEPS